MRQSTSATPTAAVVNQPIGPTHAAARVLERVSDIVLGFAIVMMLGAIIAGFVLAATTNVDPNTAQQSHPYVAAGIGLALVGLFQAFVVAMFAAWAKTFALVVKEGHLVGIEPTATI
jgi:uncharacterized membrane protein